MLSDANPPRPQRRSTDGQTITGPLRRGRIFGLIDSLTDSSAGLDAYNLQQQTQAILIGQPIEDPIGEFGNSNYYLDLPCFHLAVRYTTKIVNRDNGEPLPTAVREYIKSSEPQTNGRVMDDPVAAIARAAAERLTPEYGPRLQPEVEAAPYTRNAERGPDQYTDPVALGSLIVSIATLAWTIYNDLRAKTPDPAPEVAARTLRVELRQHVDGTPNIDKVTEVVLAEIVSGAGDAPG